MFSNKIKITFKKISILSNLFYFLKELPDEFLFIYVLVDELLIKPKKSL